MSFYMYVSKYILYVYSLMYLISAIFFISIAVFINSNHNRTSDIDEDLNNVTRTLIVVGLFLLAIAVIGVCGNFKRSTRLLSIYATLLAVVVATIFILSGSAYVMHKEIEEYGMKVMNQTMIKYNQTGEDFWTISWDYIQKDRLCCGVNSSEDWTIVTHSEQLPLSCCFNWPNGQNPCIAHDAFHKGCHKSMVDFFKFNRREDIITTEIQFATVQVLVILVTCYRRHTLRNEYKTL
ncbi:tetraspanin-3-like [Adelges cooleyi]|uniref:tetraspanin-3-like n=1 Tax=Adelges cooleyi TaxID=133065 RepID=UPI0021802534|nr:tetraspanin-3-like [Adelges cooleyi]